MCSLDIAVPYKGGLVMARRKGSSRRQGRIHRQKVNSAFLERARAVGAERFGILTVDPAKQRSAVKLTNYYGQELMAPLVVEHTDRDLKALVETVKREQQEHGLGDLVVGVERTGRYHAPIRRALELHWTVQMLHPFATKQLRQPVDPGQKTDPNDLNAMTRGMIVGYGAEEPGLPERWLEWRLVSRERENFVRKTATLRNQMKERLEALLPGYAALFGAFWQAPVALAVAERYPSAAALLQAGPDTILEALRHDGQATRRDTVARLLEWARNAPTPDPCADLNHRLLRGEFGLLRHLESALRAFECDLVQYLVDTPFVLLISIPGIHVVSSASYAAELGPLEHYLTPKNISGRAGLYPSRYQSDETDRADGPLVSRRNARLRDAIMEIAHNLIRCNHYFEAWAEVRRRQHWPARKLDLAVATRFIRISFRMVSGRMVFRHPCAQGRDAILDKLLDFALRHQIPPRDIQDLLQRALRQIPQDAFEEEARALIGRLPRRDRRDDPRPDTSGREPVRLGDLLRQVIHHLAPHLSLELPRSTTEEPTHTGGLPNHRLSAAEGS